MTKRILVIPDVHGSNFWRKPVQDYIDKVDRIVFLGDYLDPYLMSGDVYSAQALFDNVMDIVDLKRENMDKVILLKGNHDQHYASEMFRDLACGSRLDSVNWSTFNAVFEINKDIFKLTHLEDVDGTPYLFSHAGLTLYWLHKVNTEVWKLADNKISLEDPMIIDKINQLDDTKEGQKMLAVTGKERSLFGEKTGSILWADILEHAPKASKIYGLNKVYQVFGHSRIEEYDMIEFENISMIDTEQCFIIDGKIKNKVIPLYLYEKYM